MRGSPLLRAVIALAVLAALGWPMWRLTHATSAAIVAPRPVESATAKDIRLQLEFTLPPRSVKVLHLGKEVWNVSSPAASVEKKLAIPFPKEGVDLQFEIDWPGDSIAAMRIRLTDPGGNEDEKSIWGRGATSEVITFQ